MQGSQTLHVVELGGWLSGWPIGQLVGWPVGRLVGWPVGRLVGWPVGRLAGWPVSFNVLATSVCCCFTLLQLYQDGDMMYKMRKSEPTLLPSQGIFIPHTI